MPGLALPISAFVICKDEAAYIENCIRSLDVCSEIVVVDSGSTDGTLELLERLKDEGFPLTVQHNDWPGYAAQKQFALERCTQDWCLNIDADERLDADLRRLLPELLAVPTGVDGWRIARRPYLIGYGYTPPYAHERPNLRLVRRGRAAYDLTRRVHEGMVVKGQIRIAPRGSLLHYRPLPIEEQILKENNYSSLKAGQIIDARRGPRLLKLVFNPPWYFVRLYFGNRLFVCGWSGFIQAMTGAIYSFLTEAKIWQRHAQRNLPSHDEPPEAGA